MTTSAVDTAVEYLRTMRRLVPPVTCYICCHPDCERRRREALIPCVVCDARILPGQKFIVTDRVNGEVVTQRHEDCGEAGRS